MGQVAEREREIETFFFKWELKNIFLVHVIGVIQQKDEFWSLPLYSDLFKCFTKKLFISLMGFFLQFLYISPLVVTFLKNLLFQQSHLKFMRIEKSIFSCFLDWFFKNFDNCFLLLKVLEFVGCKWSSWVLCFCKCYWS